MLIPPGETVVETKPCRSCGTSFVVTDRDMDFYDRISPVFAGKKEPIPPPTLCPDCRQRRRMAWRNERKLYRRKCDLTGRDIVSIHSPDKSSTVYHPDAWWGDGWDTLSYGREYDFSRSASEQLRELSAVVPKKALNQKGTNENSEYCNIIKSMKDCYLCFAATESEGVMYSNWLWYAKDSSDLSYALHAERCYGCVDIEHCSGSSYLRRCKQVSESSYLLDCESCHHCAFCVGLRHASYRLFNEEYAPDEYEAALSAALADMPASLRRYRELVQASPMRAVDASRSEDFLGNGVYGSKGVVHGYDVYGVHDARYVFDGWDGRDLLDFYEFFDDCQLSYEGQEMGRAYRAVSCSYCYDAKNVSYCLDAYGCEHCFLCVGLRHKSYCILNKQYTEAEYNELVPKIIEHMRRTGEWGEFFSPSLSPFGYNETVAMEYFPLTKEEAIAQWFNWSDYEPPFPKVDKVIPASKLPERIQDIPNDILNWAIECEVTRKPYRIIKQELEFYRKHNLPIPRRHPDQRHLDRLSLRNPRKLYERQCDNCSKDIVTTYAPDRPERVYCEECYEREIYG